MKRTAILLITTIATAALSACTPAPNEIASRAHTGRVMDGGFTWSSGLGGTEFVMSVQNIDGMTAVCGTRFRRGVSTGGIDTKVMADYTLSVGGQRLIQGFNFFNRVGSEEELITKPAHCRDTGVPWSDRFLEAPADLSGSKSGYRV